MQEAVKMPSRLVLLHPCRGPSPAQPDLHAVRLQGLAEAIHITLCATGDLASSVALGHHIGIFYDWRHAWGLGRPLWGRECVPRFVHHQRRATGRG